MPSVVQYPTSYSESFPSYVPWSGEAVVLSVGQTSRGRVYSISPAVFLGAGMHPGCVVAQIEIMSLWGANVADAVWTMAHGNAMERSSSGAVPTSPGFRTATFSGLALPASDFLGDFSLFTLQAYNGNGLYGQEITASHPAITVTWDDNGQPGMFQFAL